MTLVDSPTADAFDPYRLPRHTLPTRYDLELVPDLAAASFTGTVTIAVTTASPAPELALNAIELTIHRCTVDGAEAGWRLNEPTERLLITPAGGLAVGDHTVTIEFTGVLNDRLRGWYRSTYRDPDGNEHVIATSQMQSTDCRRAFPCFDEPAMKAVFGVTLVVEAGHMAVSNGHEVERTERPGGKLAVRFADTMVMSS